MTEDKSLDQGSVDNSIRSVSTAPLTGNRFRVTIELAENHSKPNILLVLVDADQKEISRSMILEAIGTHTVFTMHARVPDPVYPLSLTCSTYLDEDQTADTQSILIQLA